MDSRFSVTRSAFGAVPAEHAGLLVGTEWQGEEHSMPTEMEGSACPTCGEFPPNASEYAPWSWFWDASEAREHHKKHAANR